MIFHKLVANVCLHTCPRGLKEITRFVGIKNSSLWLLNADESYFVIVVVNVVHLSYFDIYIANNTYNIYKVS